MTSPFNDSEEEWRAARAAAVSPLFDQVQASGFLESLFAADNSMPSVGDVLRAQYVDLAGRVTLGFETFERIANIVRELEGQVTNATKIQVGQSADDVLMHETERELMGEPPERGAEEQMAPEATHA